MTRTAPPPSPGQSPQCAWLAGRQDGDWVLRITGDWRGHTHPLPAPPEALQQGPAPARLSVDATGLRAWDARLASALWQRLGPLERPRVTLDLQGLPPGLRQVLAMALTNSAIAPANAPPEPAPPSGPLPRWVGQVGAQTASAWDEARTTFDFIGETLLSLGRLLRGRTDMRASDLAWQLEQTGPRSLPIVALVSFLVGLIVAYMGAAQLQRFGAQTFIADLVTVGVVREIAALLVGIVLAGRVGAAFAAQIGSMRANEEIDALKTLGVNPFDHLVLPRLLAMLVAGPLLTAFAAVVGMAVGWLVAVVLYGVMPLDYVLKSWQALTLPHVLIGLLKGSVYAALVALAGCRQGMSAGRSAQAVGQATTAAVVQSIVWMVVAASLLTVIFQRIGW